MHIPFLKELFGVDADVDEKTSVDAVTSKCRQAFNAGRDKINKTYIAAPSVMWGERGNKQTAVASTPFQELDDNGEVVVETPNVIKPSNAVKRPRNKKTQSSVPEEILETVNDNSEMTEETLPVVVPPNALTTNHVDLAADDPTSLSDITKAPESFNLEHMYFQHLKNVTLQLIIPKTNSRRQPILDAIYSMRTAEELETWFKTSGSSCFRLHVPGNEVFWKRTFPDGFCFWRALRLVMMRNAQSPEHPQDLNITTEEGRLIFTQWMITHANYLSTNPPQYTDQSSKTTIEDKTIKTEILQTKFRRAIDYLKNEFSDMTFYPDVGIDELPNWPATDDFTPVMANIPEQLHPITLFVIEDPRPPEVKKSQVTMAHVSNYVSVNLQGMPINIIRQALETPNFMCNSKKHFFLMPLPDAKSKIVETFDTLVKELMQKLIQIRSTHQVTGSNGEKVVNTITSKDNKRKRNTHKTSCKDENGSCICA
eukprot:gene3633-7240_t